MINFASVLRVTSRNVSLEKGGMPFLLMWDEDVLAGDPAAILDSEDGDGKVASREKPSLSNCKATMFFLNCLSLDL